MKIQATQSVQLPLPGVVNNLQVTVSAFSLFSTSIEVIWQLSGETVIKEGTISLPKELISSWGTDDTIVKDYVLQQLGLVEDTTTDPIVEPVVETPPTEETPQ